MARAPSQRPDLRVVEDDMFDDLADIPDAEVVDAPAPSLFHDLAMDEGALDGEIVGSADEFGIDLDTALSELIMMIDGAVDFMETELLPGWERSEKFYAGETDLPEEEGRSKAVETVVRDAVRSIKPNVMRVFTQFHEIIEYRPANSLDFQQAALAQAQSQYANELFWNNGGYTVLNDVTHNSLLKRSGIIKTFHATTLEEDFFIVKNVTEEELQQLSQMEDVTIVNIFEEDSVTDAEGGVTGLFRVEVSMRKETGENRMDAVDLNTFFVDDSATCPEDAKVIGERTSVTVGEALSMGLDYDGSWLDLDDYDPGLDVAAEEERIRRGADRDEEDDSHDLSNHTFMLTEAYASFDMDGTGIPQYYRFFLGGTNYEYLGHDRVKENPYSVCNGDPMPKSFFGRDLVDILDEDQNTQTSMLRATLDNAHTSNNRRLAVHDTLVNMADVMNTAIGAPIRFRTPGMIQEIGVQSTLGTMLPLLQYLRQGSEIKAGVTNAAMGLDPDALQSTDKDAVHNTIQLAQGQVELFCRNLAETGLRSAFSKLLRLSLQHPPKDQPIPLAYKLFDPRLSMKVRIGLGTGNLETRIAALQQVAVQQKEIITEYGMTNPICGLQHMMNTVVDLGTLMGLPNMGRYFASITPEVMAQLDQMQAEKQAAQQQEPPSAAIALAEEIRGKASMAKQQMINEQQTKMEEAKGIERLLHTLLDDDFRRDQLAQQLEIESSKITKTEVNQEAVRAEQQAQRSYDLQKTLIQLGAERVSQMEAMQAAKSPEREAIPSAPQNAAAQPAPQGEGQMAPQQMPPM